jgi:glutaminyl-peptide cyclotransferase
VCISGALAGILKMMRFALLLLLLLAISCNGRPAARAGQPETPSTPASGQDGTNQPAADDTHAALYRAHFDATAAWGYLVKQVSFGPRVPGTKSHTACRRYMEQELLKYCDSVERQEFTAKLGGQDTKLYNIIGSFKPDAPRRILLCAHWDSRPTADQNPEGQRNQPIDGANDGASGVAVLLELARVFKDNPPPVGVDLALFDAEDYGPSVSNMFLGAKYFAKQLLDSQVRSYNYGILLDMVGDRNLDIRPESNSEAVAGSIYAVAVEISHEMGYLGFKESGALNIQDDHLSLQARGIRVYDFIDFNYDYWHTTKDTVDKCSPDSLEAVGRTVENMVYLFPDIYAPKSN